MKKMKKALGILLAICLLTSLLTGCENGGKKDPMVGSWYVEGNSTPQFTLYDDGTCEIKGEYGSGTWSVVNGNQLKLTNFYGEVQSAKIKNIEGERMTLGDDEGHEIVLVNQTEKEPTSSES